MKFETPAGANPTDRLEVLGKPTSRYEGPLKTTGTAKYAYEQNEAAPNAAYGYVLGAAIAKGTIRSINLRIANASPGVLGIVTYQNIPRLGVGEFYVDRTLAGPDVAHYHQAVAVVAAETFEQARAAANLIEVKYEREPGKFDLAAGMSSAVAPKPGPFSPPAESRVGDFEGAFVKAPVTIDATYTTPDHAHAMMEPHATIAAWKNGKLTLWTSIQQMNWGVRDLADTLHIDKADIRMISPYIGGGFGGKGTILCDAVLASLAARMIGRPVKLTLPRPLMFNNLTHRPATLQRVRLGATQDGTLTAIGHESLSGNLPGGSSENCTLPTKTLYAGPNRFTRLRLTELNLSEGAAMRAPGEASGMMALEIAMDELAEKLGIDPVALRVKNDTQVDPADPKKPFSTRQLVKCLQTGAERFGWNKRNAKPGMTRDGQWLLGIGVASAIRGAPALKSAARVRLDRQGFVTVETDMTDIGTGTYTIIAQTAAEVMGISLDRVVVRLGDSSFPESPGSGGQWGAASSTAGVYAACMKLREAVAEQLGFHPEKAEFSDGEVRVDGKRWPLADAAKAGDLVAEDAMEYGTLNREYLQTAFGAHFVEVGVHAATGEIRIRRMLAVCAAGRILNPKTARSQVIGGMTMGAGAALMEEMVVDKKAGFFVNHDLAGYEVPVHMDIPHQDVVFLEEIDPTMGPLKAKGVGELGISGAAPAVANAIYNATGIRVRQYPITLDKLLDQLPPLNADRMG